MLFFKRICLLFGMGMPLLIQAQNVLQGNEMGILNYKNATNVLAPSPGAASLGKFGDIQVSGHTGIPQIGVPVYSWKSSRNNLKLDISLSYHAGGIKVEDIAPNVGLGWALNAGAVITRSVRGLPDDGPLGYLSTPVLPDYNTSLYAGGFYENDPYSQSNEIATIGSDPTVSSQSILAEFNAPNNDITTISGIFNGTMDAEQDLFYYSVQGASGKFVINKDGIVQKLDDNNLLITLTRNAADGNNLNFTIVTGDGLSYLFNKVENTDALSITDGVSYVPGSSAETNNTNEQIYPSSYYASVIKDLNTGDAINFTYTSRNIRYYSGFSENEEYHDNDDYPAGTGPANTISSYTASHVYNQVSTLALTGITLPDHSTVSLLYNQQRLDLDGDYALTDVRVSDITGTTQNYRLDYDYFNYNNDYPSLPAYSLWNLTSINNYTFSPDHVNKRLKLVGVDKLSNDLSSSLNLYQFTYSDIALPPRNCKAQDYWGYFTGPDRQVATLIPQLATFETAPQGEGVQQNTYYNIQNSFLEGADRTPHANYCKAGVISRIQYPTGGSSAFEFEANNVYTPIDYHGYENRTTLTTRLDGASTAQAFSLAGQAVTSPVSGVNFYINFDRVNADGTPYVPPVYDPNNPQSCLAEAVDLMPITFTVTSLDGTVVKSGNFNAVSQSHGYAWVFFLLPYGESYQFNYSFNTNNDPCLQNLHFVLSTVVEYQAVNTVNLVGGIRVKQVSNYDGVKPTPEVITYNYNDANGHSTGILPLIPNNQYHVHSIGKWSTCSADTTVLPVFLGYARYKARFSGSTQTLGYCFGGNIGYGSVERSQYSAVSGANGKTVTQYSVPITQNTSDIYPYKSLQIIDWGSGHPLDESVYDNQGNLLKETVYQYQDNADEVNNEKNRSIKVASIRSDNCAEAANPFFNRRYVAHTYYPFTGKSFLSYKKETNYKGTTSSQQETFYTYNTTFDVLTEQRTQDSKGNTTSEEFNYTFDFSTGGNSFLSGIHVINQPVTQKAFQWLSSVKYQVGGSAVEYNVFNSNSFSKPAKFYSFQTNAPVAEIPLNTSSVMQSSYDNLEGQVLSYDAQGNPLETLAKNGITTALIWGYQHTLPIAKITGAGYAASIATLTSITIDDLQAVTDEATLRAKVNEIRQGFSTNNMVQVTGYTYKPLYGISSETDANNRNTYYEYDPYGRLSLVRDFNNNILKSWCYRYASEQVDCDGVTVQPAIYAKLTLENQQGDLSMTYYDAVVRFYSDPSCTLPVVVNGLTVHYTVSTSTSTPVSGSVIATGSSIIAYPSLLTYQRVGNITSTIQLNTGAGYIIAP